MELTAKLLSELQRRLKIGNRRGVHLNAIPANSRYKFDIKRLASIDKDLPNNFIEALLTQLPLKFKISWKDNVPDLNTLFEEDQAQLVRITKGLENLINQTEAIESEKGINTFGFGFPILARRDKLDNKLTVSPILIWSLRIRRTKEFNTWEIQRSEDDPIYINEILINHLQSDSNVEIEQLSNEMLEDGLLSSEELIETCCKIIRAVNTTVPTDLLEIFSTKLRSVVSIGDKSHYETLTANSTSSFVEFGGLFSIFEVQKQNIIADYINLMDLEGRSLELDDLEDHQFQSISSVETDPSQQSILHALESKRNVLIQGPPGTGKSQTLTAVLINALENKKKTIVVCEKRTALEVLHDALLERGLQHECILIRDIVKDRKAVVDSVRARVDNAEFGNFRYNYSMDSLESITVKAKELIATINRKHNKLGQKLIANKGWTHVVGEMLSQIKGTVDETNLKIDRGEFNYSVEEFNYLLELVQKGQRLYSDYQPIASTAFLNPLKLIGDNPYLIEQDIKDDFEIYSQQLKLIKLVLDSNRSEYVELRNNELNSQIASVTSMIAQLLQNETEVGNLVAKSAVEYTEARREELTEQVGRVSPLLTAIESIVAKRNPDMNDERKIKSWGFRFLSMFSGSKKQTLADYSSMLINFSELESQLNSANDLPKTEFKGILNEKIKNLDLFKQRLADLRMKFDEIITKEFQLLELDKALESNSSSVLKLLHAAVQKPEISHELKNVLESTKISLNKILANVEENFKLLEDTLKTSKDLGLSYTFEKSFEANKFIFSTIQSDCDEIKCSFEAKIQDEFDNLNLYTTSNLGLQSLPILQEKVAALANKIQSDDWSRKKIKLEELDQFVQDLETLIIEQKAYFNSEKDLFNLEFNWFQFYNKLSGTEKEIIEELTSKTSWRTTFLIFYLNSLLTHNANIDLPVNDEEHKELDRVLSRIEREQLKFIKEFWHSTQINSKREFEQNNSHLSIENLYNKRSSHRFKRLSLRQIVQFDSNLFSSYFPIILTSPDVASNLFKGMNKFFDIVMFDEASQLRLEDNLPAVLKGKQVIIAGDEHQMPPSNYFSKVVDGTAEDEADLEEEVEFRIEKDDILLSCESLLDFGTELNFQKKYLDFHYRSRHPFLIDFSNYAFYNQRLKPLPNSFNYTPIKYIQINGTFSDHTNEAEAEMVLSILEHNIHRLPSGEYPTVGIATFNITQRNLIKSKILERQKFSKFSVFNSKIQELEENGMFVKNLENIQGDERDVIILSTTYGVGKDGKFARRFGPINHSKGYKLLNVIITRAKYKVYCCTSIPEQVFMDYQSSLISEGANNKSAVFFAYLAYCKAVSEGNNELRVSVLTSLAENSTQSVSIDPNIFGELESPFEEEVYQRLADELGADRLTPQLQFAGFRIDIVYQSKLVGVPKIAIECDGAKYHSSREAYLHDRYRQRILEDQGFVFHRIWSTNWWRNPGRETAKLIEFIKNTESNPGVNHTKGEDNSAAFTDEVVLQENRVIPEMKLKSENENRKIQAIVTSAPIQAKIFTDEVRLNSKVKVKYLNNGKDIQIELVTSENNKSVNGIQKVYYKSPIAVSLIGRKVGEIVKVGNLDNFVEILEIINAK